ncbi:TetR/AcrR family transcriptional regulator [Haloimpatiens sp. FM7315]|uniref:TetR/AcrR family transcriptional regulator n=1 Tax=Haloimpatiens sp. FM7315 TaxID=3298609 RepID=UPI0035A2EBC7
MAARKAVENRENDILNAAIKIFSERGYNAARTCDIAKEAGVSEGTVFRYFKNKDELLHKVMIKLIEILGNKLITKRLTKIIKDNREKGEREVLKQILKDRIELFETHEDIFKVVITEIQYNKELRDTFVKNIIMKGKDVISIFIEEGIASDIFREIDVAIVIRSFIGMVSMYIIQNKVFPEIIQIDKEKQLDEMVDLILYGIKK